MNLLTRLRKLIFCELSNSAKGIDLVKTVIKKVVCQLSLILFGLSNCTDQDSNAASTFIENKSGKSIAPQFYSKTQATGDFYAELRDLQGKKVYSDGNEGKGRFNYYVLAVSILDSVFVNFPGGKRSVHYPSQTNVINSKAIPFSSNRNLFNPANFVEHIFFESDKRIEIEYTLPLLSKIIWMLNELLCLIVLKYHKLNLIS